MKQVLSILVAVVAMMFCPLLVSGQVVYSDEPTPVSTIQEEIPIGDLFYLEGGLRISWDGIQISVSNGYGSVEFTTAEQAVNVETDRITFLAISPDPEASDIFAIEADVGLEGGRITMWIDIHFVDGSLVAMKAKQFFMAQGKANVIVADACDCDDGISMGCTRLRCEKVQECTDSTNNTCRFKKPTIVIVFF